MKQNKIYIILGIHTVLIAYLMYLYFLGGVIK